MYKRQEDLYSTDEMKKTTREFLQGEFNYLRSSTKDLFTSFEEKRSLLEKGKEFNWSRECQDSFN